MTSARDEHMARTESLLGELLERQRLSRFDTVMFLAYPIVILGMTVLPNAFLQYQEISFMGVHLVYTVLPVSMAFVFGLVVGFLYFVHVYLSDNLRGRMFAAQYVIINGSFLPFGLLLILLVTPIQELALKGSSQILWGALPVALTGFLTLTSIQLMVGMTLRVSDKIAQWFETNVPIILKVNRTFLPRYDRDEKDVIEDIGLLIKFCWAVVCLLYGLMVILAVWADGLHGIAAYHTAILIGLICATLVVADRKRLRAILSDR
jgi:hypothetical protein